MGTILKIGLLIFTVCITSNLAQRPFVNIPGMGAVRGQYERSTVYDYEFASFRGIPFAKPPSGNLRFKAPEPAEPWKETLNANIWGEVCHQSGPAGSKTDKLNYWQKLHSYFGDNSTHTTKDPKAKDPEDCLFLNVYTRSIDPDAKLPVMVYYHGGSFTTGGSYIYFPDFFMDHEMVLVVPHYRLGPLGFLSMQNEEIPGNAAMLDQIFALEWVQKYIHVFGGDKTQVTAFGESAGAASVSLLAISPLKEGLFNRIIAQSGAALAEWSFDPDPLYSTRGVASKMGCDMTNDTTITQCLMSVEDPGYLNDAQDDWSDEERKRGKNGFGGTTPVVQTTGRIFLDRMPIEIWNDPEFVGVPAMSGANKHEGTFVLGMIYDDYMKPNNLLEDENFLEYDIVKPFMSIFGITDGSYVTTDATEEEYIGKDRMGNLTAMAPGLIDFGGAMFLKAPGYQSIRKHAKFGPSYWYVYNFHGLVTVPLCGGVVGTEYPWPPGVCHAAEIPMLFGIPGVYAVMGDREKELARQMTKMWFNFAKYGNPTPEENPIEGDVPIWPPYDDENMFYVRLDRNITVHSDFTLDYTVAREENFGLV